MVRAGAGRLANGNAGRHSRFASDRSPAAFEFGAGGVRTNDVDPTAGKNSRALTSFASTNRSRLAPTGIRTGARSTGHCRSTAEAVRRSERDRTGTTAHLA